jgi:ABC-type transporter Mla subunit MlaD
MSLSASARARAISCSIWKTSPELEHLKGSFTKVASNAPNTTILHEAAEDLDTAGAEIQEAKEKVAAVADGEARKPLR